jgi:hypothetical protein
MRWRHTLWFILALDACSPAAAPPTQASPTVVTIEELDAGTRDTQAATVAEAHAAAVAAAEQAEAQAKAEADAHAKDELDGKKKDLLRQITEGLAALERKATVLREKTAKRPEPKQRKAKEAFVKYEAARAALNTLAALIDSAASVVDLYSLDAKITSGLTDASRALDDVEGVLFKTK